VPHSKRVLVVGSGGREHAIAWKLASDGAEVLVAPGNAGTAAVGRNLPVAADDIPGLLDAVEKHDVDLTIVGPELPLVGGIVDAFHERKLRIFGPTADAARLEGSKAFCKKILNRGDVPTAAYREFRRPAEAREYLLAREETPLVVKADGLAAGKGVFVCSSRDDALAAVDALSEIGGPMLIEERLDGVEVSVMAITDGRTIVTLPPLQHRWYGRLLPGAFR
jgi:phosphoribosylamine--glycine ligase